jgi:GNAT superfamily N-acetyltransferase
MIPDGFTNLAPGKIASVVTFLEMRDRPRGEKASSTVVSTIEVSLRPVHAPDLNWYRALYRRAGAHWFWFSRLEMTDEQLAAVLNNSTNELYVAEHEGSEVGMAELDRSHLPNVEITFFGLFPEAMGKRLGRPFITAVLDRAWNSSVARVWLHTCNLDAPAALSFYMKCGFRPYKQAIEVADDPRIRGILPEDTAPHVPIIR